MRWKIKYEDIVFFDRTQSIASKVRTLSLLHCISLFLSTYVSNVIGRVSC